MQYGLFMMPMHLPEKPLAQAYDEDIMCWRWCRIT
jgi:hypothetical protein